VTAPGYAARAAADLVDLTVGQIHHSIRSGFLSPARGPRGEYLLSFQDLVVLRTTKALRTVMTPRFVYRGLRRLRSQLPEGRDLSSVRITAEGRTLVVRDHDLVWNVESGQTFIDFESVAPYEGPAVMIQPAPEISEEDASLPDADDCYLHGCDIEASDPEGARRAYEQAIALDPGHSEARINLGRLLHEAGNLPGAELQYRKAHESAPEDVTAAFNLGVVLEDLKRPHEAVRCYRLAIKADPTHAAAHYNLSHLYEALGDKRNAIRHLATYRKLERGE
jgi:tetratricopeptide (TPR) repeat protein